MGGYLTRDVISIEELRRGCDYPECGGIGAFEGIVRNHHRGRSVLGLVYEAYDAMAERELARLVGEVEAEWSGCHVRVKHRLGHLKIGDVAVAIVVFAPHRHEAFQACEAMIDRIKQRVPIWKKEIYVDGDSAWVSCQHDHKCGGGS